MVFDLINAAAETDTYCPSNQEIADQCGYEWASTPRNVMRRLEDRRLIKIEGKGHLRIVHIVATGKSTRERADCIVPQIIRNAANIWGVRASDIYGPSRFSRFVRPRMAACLAACEAGLKYAEIGGFLGLDHSTVIYARRKAGKLADADPDFRAKLAMLRAYREPVPMQVAA